MKIKGYGTRLWIVGILVLSLVHFYGGGLSYGATKTELGLDQQLNILLLNSYHDGYVWSNDLKAGVKDVFDVHFSNYNMRIEHMDTKNKSSDAYLMELRDLYKSKFDPDTFDLIICADDNALKFLLKYQEEVFGNTPVFFCGVNTLEAYDLEGRDNIYGVVEKSSTSATVDIALKQNPNLQNVYLVVDDSVSGRLTKTDVRRDLSASNPDIKLEIFEDMTIYQIQEAVSKLNPEDTIVMQTFYVVDVDGAVYPLEYTADLLIEASNVPIYGLFNFGFGRGTVGGKFVEGYSQGTQAAEMASAYIENVSTLREHYVVDDTYNRFKFDYKVMEKYNLPLDVLPENSIIINVPESFYDRHRIVINVSLLIVFMLVIYVVALRIQLATQTMKITRTQKDLMESEKMASLGRLVAGVAHEINTPVGIGVTLASHIDASSRAVRDLVDEGTISKQEFNEYVDDLRNTSVQLVKTMDRASELVKSFKRVAVDQSSDEHREINLSHYFEEIIHSLKNELKRSNVDVRIICKENLVIWSHAGAIYQIMLNLIMNSIIHGFEGRTDGMIEVTAMKVNPKKNGQDFIRIKYRDFGVGMTQNTLDNLYEPFFTTRRGDGGSGLGMNIVYNLVTQRLQGSIECLSAEAAGTEFIIEFPVEYPEHLPETD